ncbi:MAG: exopolysaccharide biosynthesis protein [Erysipelotrichaceae bacterium]|nr:exopolysaccharide biosynthesis protein [Erysipelotrichaceae bacterium]
MILVTLGTQDKAFERLLRVVDEAIEKGIIQEEVHVQAGFTAYSSKNMHIVDYFPQEEFDVLIHSADMVITHGGAGTILTALKSHKKVLGAARLAKYGEHVNDHQIQLLGAFDKMGYLIYMEDLDDFEKYYQQIKEFKPKLYESNTGNMIKLIEEYINK